MKRLLPLTLALSLALTGCAPSGVEATPPATTSTQSPSPVVSSAPVQVYTDFSQLTPYEKPVTKYTRRYEGFTDTLIPSKDYGPLISFPGGSLSTISSWFGSWDSPLYGLMTLEGEVVVDPVFSSVHEPIVWGPGMETRHGLGCLLLEKVVIGEDGQPMEVAALCARDGSWCTGFDYSYDWEIGMDNSADVVPMLRGGSAIAYLDPETGKELKIVDISKVKESFPNSYWFLSYILRYDERYVMFSDDAAHYIFDGETGDFYAIDAAGDIISPYNVSFSQGLCRAKTVSGWGYLNSRGEWVIDPIYQGAENFENGRALVQDREGRYHFLAPDGHILYTFPDGASEFYFEGGRMTYRLAGQKYILDENLRQLPLPDDFTSPSTLGGSDWLYQELPDPSPTVPGGCAFWNITTGVRRDFPSLRYDWEMEGDLAVLRSPADSSDYTLADLSTGKTTPLGRWSYILFSEDVITGELYLNLRGSGSSHSELRALNGDTLYTVPGGIWSYALWDGKLFISEGAAATLTAPDGELLFSWPLYSAAD